MTSEPALERRKKLRKNCSAVVPGFASRTLADELEHVAAWVRSKDLAHDVYGDGGCVGFLESQVAKRLGKPAAVFMPSGIMAQQIALRIHAEARGLPRFGMHPTCHLAWEEAQAYSIVMGLQAAMIGEAHRPTHRADLEQHAEPLAAVVLELPARVIGGQSPTWDELSRIKDWSTQAGSRLHLDGARLWEGAAWYGKTYAEIVDGFDSVYVSTYKGLGGFAGALLAGDDAFVAQARLWRRRMGGTLFHLGPLAASAACRFDERLALMPRLFQRTVDVAAALGHVDGLRINPAVPQANMFHLHLAADADRVAAARDAIAERDGLWLFNGVGASAVPGQSVTEIYVGDNLLALDDARITQAFARLMSLANPRAVAGQDDPAAR